MENRLFGEFTGKNLHSSYLLSQTPILSEIVSCEYLVASGYCVRHGSGYRRGSASVEVAEFQLVHVDTDSVVCSVVVDVARFVVLGKRPANVIYFETTSYEHKAFTKHFRSTLELGFDKTLRVLGIKRTLNCIAD
ncbi:hypothetical protein [Vibrio barjaei]|uniref:hypothetical protein n=1 Tax=Vibrio barjaei TaxID=1676683 RepID=UPI00228380BF|nr:hypothetical protein [Vibrio barjaei]MCY9870485.1 hypothetical protein [Vibrio barjaei]